MCSGRVDPQFILAAYAQGADGVLIGGCHPGDCHYVHGNFKTLRRFRLLRRLLADLGIEDARLRLEWISAAEGEKVRRVMNDMVDQLRPLGPLAIPQRLKDWDGELASLADEARLANDAELAETAVEAALETAETAVEGAHGSAR
jgi:F420-non-reducing hydrogenase iron-sulfur subunit